MSFVWTERFRKDFRRLSPAHQQRMDEALERYQTDPRHPSLGVKKLQGTRDIWELRVTESIRLTFHVFPEGVLLRRVGTHDVLRNP